MWAIYEKFHEGSELEPRPGCWVKLREWQRRHTKWDLLGMCWRQ